MRATKLVRENLPKLTKHSKASWVKVPLSVIGLLLLEFAHSNINFDHSEHVYDKTNLNAADYL
jgi:hypothetical protein